MKEINDQYSDNSDYEDTLLYRAKCGRKDADKGAFNLPYLWDGDQDQNNQDENHAYQDAWMKRRKELGDSWLCALNKRRLLAWMKRRRELGDRFAWDHIKPTPDACPAPSECPASEPQS